MKDDLFEANFAKKPRDLVFCIIVPAMNQKGGTSRFVRQTTLTRTKSERPITRPA